jgi:hypothetical protein
VRTDEYLWGCNSRGRLLWAPGSATLAWNDGRGLWLGGPGQEPRLLASNSLVGSHSASAWSASGQYLLGWVSYYEGGSQAVFDARSGTIIHIPGTAEYPEPVARITWMHDERLFVVRREGTPGIDGYSLSGEAWRINLAESGMRLEEDFVIASEAYGYPVMLEPVTLDGGALAFAILSQSNDDFHTRGLYAFAPGDAAPIKVNGLPPVADHWVESVWAPDGRAAIIHLRESGTVLYVLADNRSIFDLTPALGDRLCCFAWVR